MIPILRNRLKSLRSNYEVNNVLIIPVYVVDINNNFFQCSNFVDIDVDIQIIT